MSCEECEKLRRVLAEATGQIMSLEEANRTLQEKITSMQIQHNATLKEIIACLTPKE